MASESSEKLNRSLLLALLSVALAVTAVAGDYQRKRYDQAERDSMTWTELAQSLMPFEYSYCGGMRPNQTTLTAKIYTSRRGFTLVAITTKDEMEFRALLDLTPALGEIEWRVDEGASYRLIVTPPAHNNESPLNPEQQFRRILGPINFTYSVKRGMYSLAFKGRPLVADDQRSVSHRRKYIVTSPLSGPMNPNSS